MHMSLKSEMKELLLRVLLVINAINLSENSITKMKVSFAYNEDNYNHCGSRNSRFYAKLNTPFNECLIQCGARPMCKAVNFRRLMQNLCELQFNNDTTKGESGCLFIPRENIHFTGNQDNSCGCEEGQTCDIKTNTCTKSECSPVPTVQYGEVYGNWYTIGSRLTLHCNYGYKPQNDTVMECLNTGEWSSSFTCIPRRACPPKWYEFGPSCFYVTTEVDDMMEFLAAEAFCKSLGGHLIQIDTEEESNYIYNIIKGSTESFWIGLTLDITSNQWCWANSEDSPSYTNWGREQPGGLYAENCAMLWKRDNLRWHDVPCSFHARPICETIANNI